MIIDKLKEVFLSTFHVGGKWSKFFINNQAYEYKKEDYNEKSKNYTNLKNRYSDVEKNFALNKDKYDKAQINSKAAIDLDNYIENNENIKAQLSEIISNFRNELENNDEYKIPKEGDYKNSKKYKAERIMITTKGKHETSNTIKRRLEALDIKYEREEKENIKKRQILVKNEIDKAVAEKLQEEKENIFKSLSKDLNTSIENLNTVEQYKIKIEDELKSSKEEYDKIKEKYDKASDKYNTSKKEFDDAKEELKTSSSELFDNAKEGLYNGIKLTGGLIAYPLIKATTESKKLYEEKIIPTGKNIINFSNESIEKTKQSALAIKNQIINTKDNLYNKFRTAAVGEKVNLQFSLTDVEDEQKYGTSFEIDKTFNGVGKHMVNKRTGEITYGNVTIKAVTDIEKGTQLVETRKIIANPAGYLETSIVRTYDGDISNEELDSMNKMNHSFWKNRISNIEDSIKKENQTYYPKTIDYGNGIKEYPMINEKGDIVCSFIKHEILNEKGEIDSEKSYGIVKLASDFGNDVKAENKVLETVNTGEKISLEEIDSFKSNMIMYSKDSVKDIEKESKENNLENNKDYEL